MIKYFKTPGGYWANLYGTTGCIDATIHRKPERGVPWRMCFATCTGDAKHLQGKVRDRMTLEAIKHELARYDADLNSGVPITGFHPPIPKELQALKNKRKWDALGGLHMPYGD